MKSHEKEQEKKKNVTEAKKMFEHLGHEEHQQRKLEDTRRAQLKKIQEENMRTAMMKKNSKEQSKVSESLKEKELADTGAFYNKNLEVR